MTSTAPIASPATRPDGLKPVLVRGLLACLSLTALLGIYAVLTASFDETGARVLGSTLLVGLYCVLSLANLTVLGTRHRFVGRAGIAAGAVALVLGLSLIWWAPDDFDGRLEYSVRGFLFAAVLAFAMAHAALLLRIELDPAGSTARVRTGTLIAVSLVATMLAVPLVELSVADTSGYWRLVGVLGILDVLGTIALPVLARIERTATA